MEEVRYGSDYILQQTHSPLFQGYEEVTSLEQLKRTYHNTAGEKPGLVWTGAKIHADMMKKVLGTIHEFPRTETCFVIYYNSITSKFKIMCPEQKGSGAYVAHEYGKDEVPAGYGAIGTIHTHPEMSAFWSGTDRNANVGEYGIHFVFGLHEGLVKELKCTLFTKTAEYDQNIFDVVEEFKLDDVYPADEAWVQKIKSSKYEEEKERQRYSVQKSYPADCYEKVADDPETKKGYSFTSSSYKLRYDKSETVKAGRLIDAIVYKLDEYEEKAENEDTELYRSRFDYLYRNLMFAIDPTNFSETVQDIAMDAFTDVAAELDIGLESDYDETDTYEVSNNLIDVIRHADDIDISGICNEVVEKASEQRCLTRLMLFIETLKKEADTVAMESDRK